MSDLPPPQDADADTASVATRLINVLQELHDRGRIVFEGGPAYEVQTAPVLALGGERLRRWGSAAQMSAWVDGLQRGYVAAYPTVRRSVAQPDLADLRAVVYRPSLVNQLRAQVYAAMEAAGDLMFKELSERIGRDEQVTRLALSYGNEHPRVGTITLFQEMMEACGRRFDLHHLLPPPMGVRRMHALTVAADAGLLAGVSPSSPNEVRRAANFEVTTVEAEKLFVRATNLVHWVQGLVDGARDEDGQVSLKSFAE